MPTRMTYIRRRVVVASALVLFAWVGARVAPALAPPIVVPFTPWQDPKVAEIPSVSTVIPIPTDTQVSVSLCADVVNLAHSLGWKTEDLDELSYVIWRESRCLPDVHYDKDPNGGSYGLMQINGYWCEPSRYHPKGYLQAQGLLSSCDDLYIPAINLLAGLNIYLYSSEHNLNGWQPWTMQKDFCESVHNLCDPSAIVGG